MLSAPTPLSALHRAVYSRARHKSLNMRDRKDRTWSFDIVSASTFRHAEFRCSSYTWFQRCDIFHMRNQSTALRLLSRVVPVICNCNIFCRIEGGYFIVSSN